jgi:3'-5' exonuclease
MMHLVLDLETVVDPSLPAPKSKDGSDQIPPAPYHQIVVLGAALLDSFCRLRRIWIVGESNGGGEFAMLAALVAFLNTTLVKRTDLSIVSFNGRGFDLPVIVARCLRHGLAFPWYYQRRDPRHRYSAQGHLDLMDFLVDHGAGKFYSLDLAARLIGLPGKMETHGSDVAGMVARGELDQVRTYCMRDVAQTSALFLRTQLLRGELAPHRYAAAVQGMLEVFDREPRLAPMVPLIDRERLLGVPGATGSLPFKAPGPPATGVKAA